MAKSTQKSIELGELIRRSEVARLQLGQAHRQLKRKLDIPSRIQESLKSNPTKWLGGSLVTGFMGSFLFKSKSKKPKQADASLRKERGLVLGLLVMLFTLVKPAAKIYATKLLKDYLQKQLSRRTRGKWLDRSVSPY